MDHALIKPEQAELKWLISPELSFSWFYEDQVDAVCAGGVLLLWPGVGTSWFLMDKDFAPKLSRNLGLLRVFIREVRAGLRELMTDHGLHRVQADVNNASMEAQRFTKMLRFEYEGIMKAYNSEKEDYLRWALVEG